MRLQKLGLGRQKRITILVRVLIIFLRVHWSIVWTLLVLLLERIRVALLLTRKVGRLLVSMHHMRHLLVVKSLLLLPVLLLLLLLLLLY